MNEILQIADKRRAECSEIEELQEKQKKGHGEMKTKKQRNIHSRFWISLSLILCMLVTSFPSYAMVTTESNFIGLEDVEVEEGTQFDLLEHVSAYGLDHENLEIAVTAVTCQTDETFVYDNSNILTVGAAGSEYTVEYSATSPTDENIAYAGSRKIVSVKAEETEDGTPSEDTQGDNTEFDENKPFTISELEGMGYRVEMETARISTEYFDLECINEKPNEKPCADLTWGDVQEIKGGRLKETVPQILLNQKGKKHSYIKGHVGNVQVYYVGKLHIYDEEKTTDYIYYTTDKEITNKTVYAVLNEKENEKIRLSYSHDVDFEIKYEFRDKSGNITETGPEQWSYDEVFGADRALVTTKGKDISETIQIPRGYKAKITVKEGNGHLLHEASLGEMMEYETKGNDKNHIVLTEKSPKSIKLYDNFSVQNVTSDLTVCVQYEKIEKLTFNGYLWSQTVYAKDRMKVHGDKNPDPQNSILTSTDHHFVWEFDGVTTGPKDKPSKCHTWELDQLEINGEALLIPMVSLKDEGKSITNETTLSTGTKVTLTVTSKGGTNAVDGRRHYRLEIDNCYEDVTISGGNMVGHRHQEYAIHELSGVKDGGYYASDQNGNNAKDVWHKMEQDTLIGKIVDGKHDNDWTDPIRFKRLSGYYRLDVSFSTKEGTLLQKNDQVMDQSGEEPYIEYLVREDSATDDITAIGSYKVVPFSEWVESSDGYYYFRGSEKVKEFVGKKYNEPDFDESKHDYSKGVILIDIVAEPIKIALDYQNGADVSGVTAPRNEEISNLPPKQTGGKNGYNVANNSKVLVSNMTPVDTTNHYVFDHWEVLATESNEEFPLGHVTENTKNDEHGEPYKVFSGTEYNITPEVLAGLTHTFYLDGPPRGENTHAVFTVRAVWRERGEMPTIPYTVRYILAEVVDGRIDETTEKLIMDRTHTVNEGAMLITDLYQDGNKTPAESILNVLKGDNKVHKDFTENGEVDWVVYEPKTTKKIDNVTIGNNLATIYLIKGNTKVNVEKVWASDEHQEGSVTVQLQSRKSEKEPWENVEDQRIVLNTDNQWKHTFRVPAYHDIANLEAYQYQVVELDENGTAIKNNSQSVINGNTYQVGYTYDKEKDAWVIQNTRLLDLTISKVVEGNLGDHTKAFTFDIHAVDSAGKALSGDYNYLGSIKEGTGDSVQKPEDGTLTFKEGNAQISLKHGQQITIKNLPVNATITVTEQKADGYTTSYQVNGEAKDNGEVILTRHSTVDVTNKNQQVPDTGISDHTQGIAAGIAVAAVGLAFLLVCSFLCSRKGQRR